jgi:glycerol-3-phosphate dehydrogenase
LHLEDILTRRTRASIEVPDRGEAAAAERESQEQLDDQTADAARLGAPDVRLGIPEPY